ncbi:MAG: response regulator [Patescibacteria group bacterium]|nr:response regulator [Patescibacteria group bacterium]
MGKKPKILLIEDDRDQIKMYQFKFEKEGFIFLAGRSGEEGIKIAKEQNPDLILLDLVLINENGIKVLEKLKKDKALKDIPVIMLTNLAKNSMKEKSKESGATDFLVKTQIDPSELIKKVKQIISESG